ncbi:MAG: hypothetical protein AB9M60_02475 [Leptothrix sp. (in: b-proteobacteria)]
MASADPPSVSPAHAAAHSQSGLLSRPPAEHLIAHDDGVDTTQGGDSGDSDYATLIQRLPGEYLDERPDIGRAMGQHTRELFVSCEIGEALQQQFDHLKPTCIVLHDLACHTASHLLHAIGSAAGRPVQRLVVRRQGYGTTLASIEFVDCIASDQQVVRLYSTDADTDSQSRQALTRVLMSQARLAVVMVGDLPPHAVPEQLAPLRDLLFSPGWRCPHLQLMPLSSGTAITLKAVAGGLSAGAGVQTRIAPMVTRPAEAWAYLSQTWNQIQAARHPDGKGLVLLDAPAREPAQPLPDNRASSPRARPLERYVQDGIALPGVDDVCVFEIATSRVLAHAGRHRSPTELARRGTMLLTVGASSRKQLGLPSGVDELLVMGGLKAHGLRTLHAQPGLAVHVIFTPSQGDWPQLRPRLMALDAALPRSPVI